MRRQYKAIVTMLLGMAMAASGCGQATAPGTGTAPSTAETAAEGATDAAEASSEAETASTEEAEPEKSDDEKTFAELFPDIDVSGLPKCDPKDYPNVDGSTANLPLSYAVYQAVTGATLGEAKERITCSKTDYAYYNIAGNYEGSPSLLLVYEPSEQIEQDLEDYDEKLLREPIGKDALVFLTNEENPVKSLTEEELIDIYSGKIRNWKQVGGRDQEIKAFQRSQNSGSQTLMDKLVMRGTQMADAPAYMVPSEMGDLIEDVAYYNNAANALGYSVYFYARNMYNFPGLRFMAVNGTEPSNKTIGNGDYPYVNEFYAVIRESEAEDSIAHQIYDWLTTEDGQDLIEACGYVPLDGGDNETLPFDLTMLEKGDATFDLEQGTYLVIDGRETLGIDGVLVYDGTMQQIKHIEGISTEESVMVRRLDQPLVARETEEGKTGLYDLEAEDWILAPEYDTVSWNEEGEYWDLWTYDYDEATETGESHSYHYKDGRKTEVDDAYDEGVTWDDEVWIVDNDKLQITVKDKDDEVLRTIDMKDYDLSYAYVSDGYLYGNDENDSTVMFDQDMEVVFSMEALGADLYTILGLPEGHSSIQSPFVNFYNADPKTGIVQGSAYTSEEDMAHSFLYDMEDHKLLSQPGEYVEVGQIHKGKDRVYRLYHEEEGVESDNRLLDAEGEPILAEDGKPYEYSLGWNYYGYYSRDDQKTLIIDSEDGKEHYELPCGARAEDVWMPARAYAPHLFVVYGSEGSTLWNKEECILDDGYCMTWGLGYEEPIYDAEGYENETYSYVFAQGDTAKTYLFDTRDSSILWETDEKVNVQAIEGPVMYATEGAYAEFLTLHGDLVMRMFTGTSAD